MCAGSVARHFFFPIQATTPVCTTVSPAQQVTPNDWFALCLFFCHRGKQCSAPLSCRLHHPAPCPKTPSHLCEPHPLQNLLHPHTTPLHAPPHTHTARQHEPRGAPTQLSSNFSCAQAREICKPSFTPRLLLIPLLAFLNTPCPHSPLTCASPISCSTSSTLAARRAALQSPGSTIPA